MESGGCSVGDIKKCGDDDEKDAEDEMLQKKRRTCTKTENNAEQRENIGLEVKPVPHFSETKSAFFVTISISSKHYSQDLQTNDIIFNRTKSECQRVLRYMGNLE